MSLYRDNNHINKITAQFQCSTQVILAKNCTLQYLPFIIASLFTRELLGTEDQFILKGHGSKSMFSSLDPSEMRKHIITWISFPFENNSSGLG